MVKEMNQRVDSMGPINMEAIQEYDELEQRHTFLEQQYNDLTTSKAELLDVIAKINTTTRKLFAETFEQIRVNFSRCSWSSSAAARPTWCSRTNPTARKRHRNHRKTAGQAIAIDLAPLGR